LFGQGWEMTAESAASDRLCTPLNCMRATE
jgi:hypothetical protein